ncbi:hypothetical protein ABW20_dc0105854 [Dactylellina cionopaga]|nr:hypothetical protein ABW20_dc0105854 [Dactylellina cionopaga]
MANGALTADRVDALLDKLYNMGLKTKLKLAINDTLEIAFGDENFQLSSELQTRAFELSLETISNRIALEFADELLKQIHVVAKDAAPNVASSQSPAAATSTGGNPPDQTTSGGTTHFHQTPKEVYDDLSKFVAQNKSPFNFKDKELEEMAKAVAAKGESIKQNLGLNQEQLLGLAAVSLYEIVFLCDDSGSMDIGNRWSTLVKTLQSVADWATRLEPTGISLRFLNYDEDGDGDFDNLTDLEQIKDMCHLPTDDDPNCFRDALLRCKTELDEGSTIFILFRVGNSPEAEEFMKSIENDTDLEGMVHCSIEALDELEVFLSKAVMGKRRRGPQAKPAHDPNTYKRHVLDEFIKAVGAAWER